MTRIAFYPGTFDPVTNGHVDILAGALALADKVVVGVGRQPGQVADVLACQRGRRWWRRWSRRSARRAAGRVTAVDFDGLAVQAAHKRPARRFLIRGLRDANDFDYEMSMAGMNTAHGA